MAHRFTWNRNKPLKVESLVFTPSKNARQYVYSLPSIGPRTPRLRYQQRGSKMTNTKESKSNKNADSYLPHGNTILVAPPGGQSVMDINAD